MTPDSLLQYAIIPALQTLGLDSPAARNLLLGTAAQESGMGRYIAQLGGPALGPFMVEPATHNDCLRYADTKPLFAAALSSLRAKEPGWLIQLASNLPYSAAICRLKYYMMPEPLPDADDVAGLAAYWKRWYNSPAGAGTEAEFVANYHRFVLDTPFAHS